MQPWSSPWIHSLLLIFRLFHLSGLSYLIPFSHHLILSLVHSFVRFPYYPSNYSFLYSFFDLSSFLRPSFCSFGSFVHRFVCLFHCLSVRSPTPPPPCWYFRSFIHQFICCFSGPTSVRPSNGSYGPSSERKSIGSSGSFIRPSVRWTVITRTVGSR